MGRPPQPPVKKVVGRPFKEGEGGRKKGSKNKFTKLKEDFLGTFEDLGGQKGLTKWAKADEKNKTLFYQMTTRMFPKEMELKGDGVGAVGIVVLPEVKEK